MTEFKGLTIREQYGLPPAQPGDYDSTEDTMAHINRVRVLLEQVVTNIRQRAQNHDATKLVSPEKDFLDHWTPRLADSTYGSPEYRAMLSQMKPGLDHHYAHSSHHPEHYPEGIEGMDLLDMVEMLADWKAAGERHKDGSLYRSFIIQRERFHIKPALFSQLVKTAARLGWLTKGQFDQLLPQI